MKVATLQQAKSRLGELVARAEQGETIIIKRNGKPAVRLTPLTEPELELGAAEARKLNAWADGERASGRTKVFESPAKYAAHVRAKRTRKGKPR